MTQLTPEASPSRRRIASLRSRLPSVRRQRSATRRHGEFRKGFASTARLLLTPLGWRAAKFHKRLSSKQRLQRGLVMLLPGIDGTTTVSDNIARGMYLGGVEKAVEVYDWRSFPGWNPLHLATYKSNLRHAGRIAGRILEYKEAYPDRPVHLVGHSAGAGMSLFVLQELADICSVDSVVLLAAAISRRYDVQAVAENTKRGVWNFSSKVDIAADVVGTTVFGNMDRKHGWSAGAMGFKLDAADLTDTKVHEVPYRVGMAKHWNFGGHFGCTNVSFVSRYVAPIIAGAVTTAPELMEVEQQAHEALNIVSYH